MEGLFLFQFTPLREGRQNRRNGLYAADYFNSRPSARGDNANARAVIDALFQFTPLREGRRKTHRGRPRRRCISIHAPPRGATTASAILSNSYLFQFTPLREGRRNNNTERGEINISIHAPPRGATRCGRSTTKSKAFQFTPLREGRRAAMIATLSPKKFQFTPLREGRQGRCTGLLASLCISIHAPPRGATAAGADGSPPADFNSRPSARGDAEQLARVGNVVISIHAPPRGATVVGREALVRPVISIHAPPRGAT